MAEYTNKALVRIQSSLDRIHHTWAQEGTVLCQRLEDAVARNASGEDEVALDASVVQAMEERISEQEERIHALEHELQTVEENRGQVMEQLRVSLDTERKALDHELTLRREIKSLRDKNAMLEERLEATTALVIEEEEEVAMAMSAPAFSPSTIGHNADRSLMGEMLVQAGIITTEQCTALLKTQRQELTTRLGELAVKEGYASENSVAHTLAAQLKLDYVNLEDTEPATAVVDCISPHLARLHQVLPLREEQNGLIVAMANPLDLIALEDLELALNKPIQPVVAASSLVRAQVEKLYPASFNS